MTSRKFGLLSSSVLYGLGGAAQRLISLILLPLFTRYLTPADYGVIGLLGVLPGLLLPVFSMGLSASIGVCYFAAKYSGNRESVIQTSRWIAYYSSLIMTILAIAESNWIAQLATGSMDYQYHTLVVIATVVFSVISLPLQLELQFSGRPLDFVVISFVGAVFASFCSVISVVWIQLGALGVLLGSMLGQALVWILLLLRKKNGCKIQGQVNLDIAKELLKHGLPFLPGFIFLFMLQNGVRWILESKHSVEAVGLYSIGTSFGAVLALITSGFITAWMPWAMQFSDSWEEKRQVIAQRLMQYMIGAGFLVLLFFCFAQPVLRVLTPATYFDAWMVVGLAASANFMMSLFSLVLPPVYIAGKVSLTLISQGIAALVALGSAYILIDLGIIGASIAVLLGTVFLVIVQLVVNVKLTNLSPLPFNVKIVIPFVLVLGLSCWATFWLDIAQIGNFVLISLTLLLFCGLVMFGIFPDKTLLFKKFLR